MGSTRNTGLDAHWRIGRIRNALFLLGTAFLLGMTGCSNTGGAIGGAKGGDPLLGEPPAMPKGSVAPATPAGFTKPPAPGARPTGSVPASLVSNTEIPRLEGAKPLAIDAGWQREYDNTPKHTGPKVMPVPLEKSATPGLLPTGGWTPDGKVAPLTPVGGDAIGRLERLGALGIRQEAVPGGVRVSCFTMSRSIPGATRMHEATGANLNAAVEAILEQISRD